MGMRPPTEDRREPATAAFGIAALVPLLCEADLSYPVDGETLLNALEDPQIPVDASGRTVSLSTTLEDADRRRFDSECDLLNALHPVFESYRENVSTTVFAQIRNLLPTR